MIAGLLYCKSKRNWNKIEKIRKICGHKDIVMVNVGGGSPNLTQGSQLSKWFCYMFIFLHLVKSINHSSLQHRGYNG